MFEAIYVALYGEPLVGEESRARLEEVIAHGQTEATVKLTVAVGPHELTIRRTFKRDRPQLQRAAVTIRRPGVPDETISRIRPVNERVLRELAGLDGDSLRNSCFVEQQELGRLESLSRVEREQAVHKLLGLERLTLLARRFRYTREQERELQAAERFHDLAAKQAEAERLARDVADLAARRDAAKVALYLDEIEGTRREVADTQRLLDVCHAQEGAAREGLGRCAQLRAILSKCDDAGKTVTELGTARKEWCAASAELAELDRLTRDEEPVARNLLRRINAAVEVAIQADEMTTRVQQTVDAARTAADRVASLTRAEEAAAQRGAEVEAASARHRQRIEEARSGRERAQRRIDEIAARRERLTAARGFVAAWEETSAEERRIAADVDAARAREQQLAALESELARREVDLGRARDEVFATERATEDASAQVRRASVREALSTWARLKGVEARVAGYDGERAALEAERTTAMTTLITCRRKARTLGMAFGGGIVATALAGVGSLIAPLLLALAALLLLGALGLGAMVLRSRREALAASASVATLDMRLRDLDVAHTATVQASGDPGALLVCEAALRDGGAAIPAMIEEAQAILVAMTQIGEGGGEDDARALRERERNAAAAYAAAVALAERARDGTEAARCAVAEARVDNPGVIRLQMERDLATQKDQVGDAERVAHSALGDDLPWPTDVGGVDAALGQCERDGDAARRALDEGDAETSAAVAQAVEEVRATERARAAADQAVTELRAQDPGASLARAQSALDVARKNEAGTRRQLQLLATEVSAVPQRGTLEAERGRVEERMRALEARLEGRAATAETVARRAKEVVAARTKAHQVVADVLAALQPLIEEQSMFLDMPSVMDADGAEITEVVLLANLDNARARATARLDALDEASLRARLDATLREVGTHASHLGELGIVVDRFAREIVELLTAHGCPTPADVTPPLIADAWPLVASVAADGLSELTTRLEDGEHRLFAARQSVAEQTKSLDHDGTYLDLEECAQRVAALRDERDICREATSAIGDAQERIARHVLPTTERNMQLLLPQLTAGRYRDVRLTAPEGDNGQPGEMDYRIRVWDPMAGRYVAKNLFSGGTRDQCSLALRLAFALATLPQELGVAPGFIVLDEPLAAFDAERAQALVALLMTGTIAEQFAQVIVISHGHAFDRSAFAYHVVMERGRVCSSTLPRVEKSAAGADAAPDGDEGDLLSVGAAR